MSEEMVGHIFVRCALLHLAYSQSLYRKLNNQDRIILLKALIEKNENSSNAREASHPPLPPLLRNLHGQPQHSNAFNLFRAGRSAADGQEDEVRIA